MSQLFGRRSTAKTRKDASAVIRVFPHMLREENIDMKSPRDEQNEGDSQSNFWFLAGQAKCQYHGFHFQASETVGIAAAQDFS